MAKYITFEELQGAKLGLHQFPGTVGKHKLEVISEKPDAIQVKGHPSYGDPTKVITITPGQTLAYDGGKIWVVRPYSGNDPVRKLLNEHHLPKDFVEYVPLEDLFQDGDDTEEYRDWSCISGKVTVTPWPSEAEFQDDTRHVLPKRINAVYQEVNRHGNLSQGYRKLVVAHGTEPDLICEALWETALFWTKRTWNSESKSAVVRPEYRQPPLPQTGYCRQRAQIKLALLQAELDQAKSPMLISTYVANKLKTDPQFLDWWFVQEDYPMGTAEDVVKICASVRVKITL